MDIQNSTAYQNLMSTLTKATSADVDDEANSEALQNTSYESVSTDTVSVSLRAEKLSRIASEYFSGTLSSDELPELMDRLYEDGLLSESEYQSLGGETQSVSAITEASSFLNQFIMDESVDGDSETAESLLNVVEVLNSIDSATTDETLAKESEAYEFVASYTELLQEAGAPEDVIDGFENVLDVLGALDTVRNSEQSTAALTSYASVQEAYEALFTDS